MNSGTPYYHWEINNNDRLVIYSECCADTFTPDQQYELWLRLSAIYQGRLTSDK